MTDPRSEQLVRELVRDLEPVAPVPRLRSVALVAVAVFGATLGVRGLAGGSLFGAVPGAAWGETSFLLLLMGMALAGVGGLTAALAGSVPGRELPARRGRTAAALGGVIVAAGAVGWSLGPGSSGAGLAGSLGCAARAALFGLGPALVAAGFAAHCRAARPLAVAVLAALGGVALGALAVQVSCSETAILHVAVGHCAAPLLAVLLLAAPLALWIRRPGATP